MYDYQITAKIAQSRSQALVAEAEASRLAKAARAVRAAVRPRNRRRWVWLEYRPTIRAFSGAR